MKKIHFTARAAKNSFQNLCYKMLIRFGAAVALRRWYACNVRWVLVLDWGQEIFR